MRPNKSLPLPFRNSQLFNLIQFTESKIFWLEEETSPGQCPADKLLAPITAPQKTGRLLNTPDSVFKWLPTSPPTPYSHDPALLWLCHRIDIAPSSFFPISCNTQHPLTTGREIFPLFFQVLAAQVSPTVQVLHRLQSMVTHVLAIHKHCWESTPPVPWYTPSTAVEMWQLHDSTQSSLAVSEPFPLQEKYHREKPAFPWLEASQEKRICP